MFYEIRKESICKNNKHGALILIKQVHNLLHAAKRLTPLATKSQKKDYKYDRNKYERILTQLNGHDI